jgi:glutamyl-tRNA synthetase
MAGLKERARTLIELLDSAAYLLAERPLHLDEKAAALLDAEARALLQALLPQLQGLTDWTQATTETVVREFAEARGLKLGKVAQPIRAAVTGRTTSPPIFDVLHVLGRDEALGRIADQVALA